MFQINIAFYQFLYDSSILPLLAQVKAQIGNIIPAARIMLLGLGAVYLPVLGFEIASHKRSLTDLKKELFLLGVGLTILATGGSYMSWIGDLFLTGLPTDFAKVFGGLPPMALIDKMQNTLLQAGVKLLMSLSNYSLSTIPIGMMVLVYMFLAVLSSLVSFATYAASIALAAVCVYIGPFGMAAWCNAWTRKAGSAWFAVLCACTGTAVISLAILTLVSNTEMQMVTPIVQSMSNNQKLGQDQVGALCIGIIQCLAIVTLATYLVAHSKPLAHAILGGVYHATLGAAVAAFGVAKVAAGTGRLAAGATASAARVAGAAGGRAGQAIGYAGRGFNPRPTSPAPPVGGSLSGRHFSLGAPP